MKYTRFWSERYCLPDGTTALLRLVRPTDRPWFAESFERFSAATMFRRLMVHKTRFSEPELRYLTECDGIDHLAIIAFRRTGARWEGLASGRFVLVDRERHIAEFAVLVGDPVQGMGLGTRVVQHLVCAARERGIVRFKADMLAENTAIFRLVDRLAPEAEWLTDGIVALVEFDLDRAQA